MWTGGRHGTGNEIYLVTLAGATWRRDRWRVGQLAGRVEQRSALLPGNGCQGGKDSERGERGVSLRLAIRTGQAAAPEKNLS